MYCTQINWWFLRAEVEFVVCKQVPHLSLAFSKAAITVETELNSVAAVSLSSRNCRFILGGLPFMSDARKIFRFNPPPLSALPRNLPYSAETILIPKES